MIPFNSIIRLLNVLISIYHILQKMNGVDFTEAQHLLHLAMTRVKIKRLCCWQIYDGTFFHLLRHVKHRESPILGIT